MKKASLKSLATPFVLLDWALVLFGASGSSRKMRAREERPCISSQTYLESPKVPRASGTTKSRSLTMALRLRLYLLLFGPTFPTRWLLEIPDSKTTTSRSQKKAARLFPQRFRKKTGFDFNWPTSGRDPPLPGFDFNWPPSRRDPLLHQLLYCISLTKPRRSAHPWNWENPLYPRYEQSMGGVHKRKAGSHSYW